jgi:restriction system protein
MPRRRGDGVLDDLFEAAALLPWWVGVTLAIAAYALLHHYAAARVPPVVRLDDAGQALGKGMIKGLAGVGQYALPLVLLMGAINSVRRRWRRSRLYRDVASDESGRALRAMSWRDFELLVGEAFRKRGYWVTEAGGGGADGGIDAKLEKGGEVFLVQCKQWRAYKVSVNVVRELLGVMVAQGATGGFVVTSGVFTAEAEAFAKGRNIELLDGAALAAMIGKEGIARAGVGSVVKETGGREPAAALVAGVPACPVCGRGMVQRTARRGPNAGGVFWGCPAYPQCRGRRAID